MRMCRIVGIAAAISLVALAPAKAAENVRVEAARLMMERRQRSDRNHRQANRLRRSRPHAPRLSARAFGQPPQAIRRNARSEAAREALSFYFPLNTGLRFSMNACSASRWSAVIVVRISRSAS